MLIEIEGTYKGYKFLVVAQDMGHRCGYVRIPEKHRLYGKDYSYKVMIDGKRAPISDYFDVHGGLTFSDKISETEAGKVKKIEGWWLGFDCEHFGDAKDKDIMSEEYKKIFSKSSVMFEGEIRTANYVKKECFSLIDQIEKLTKTYNW